MKFGGSSLAGVKEILQSIGIVKQYAENSDVVVVCSAMGDTTDHLVQAVETAKTGKVDEARKLIDEVRTKHEYAISETIRNDYYREDAVEFVADRYEEINRALLGISLLNDVSPRSLDYVLSFGEQLSTMIINNAILSTGKLRSKYLTGGNAGIVTDRNFGAAAPMLKLTGENLNKNLLPLLEEGTIPIVAGYIAEAHETFEITTLGRGGSDYTASLIAAAIGADEVLLWTDVDGILTADPKIVKDARIVERITYFEAMEMSAFGAKAMQPQALEPVAKKGISVRIKNTFRPQIEGTLIGPESGTANGTKAGVKSVGAMTGIAIVNIGGTSIVGSPGTAIKIFEILKELKVGILMISQSVSENNVSLTIRKDPLPKVIKAFRTELLHEDPEGIEKGSNGAFPNSKFSKVEYEDDVSVIAVLGRGMSGTPGIAGRVFTTVARQGINIRMIAQGSSEINISFVIKDKDRARAVIALHEEFGLGQKIVEKAAQISQ